MKWIVKEYQECDSLVDAVVLTSDELCMIKKYLSYTGIRFNKELIDKLDQLLLRDHTCDARRWEDDGGQAIT